MAPVVTIGYRDGVTLNNAIDLISPLAGGSLTLDVASGRAVQAGEISNPFFWTTLTKAGAGTLALTAANPFLGLSLTVNAGTIEIGHADAIGGTSVVLNGGGLRAAVDATLAGNFKVEANIDAMISAATGTTLTLAGPNIDLGTNGTVTFGSTGDTGTVVLASIGMSPPANVNLHIAGGTLRTDTAAFGTNSPTLASTRIDAAATLDLNGFDAALKNLSGAGTLATGSNPAMLLQLVNADFAGAITGAGAVQILNGPMTGLSILSGVNTYTGGTTIDVDAILQLGTAARAGSLVGNLVNDGTFNIVNGTLAGTTVATSGEVNFYGTSTAGNANITNNGLSPGGVTFRESSSAGTAAIVNNGTLAFTDNSTAGAASISNFGEILFSGQARAGTAHIVNDVGGALIFGTPTGWATDTPSADQATILNKAGSQVLLFFASSSAGQASIVNEAGAGLLFVENSTAGQARIVNGGFIGFALSARAGSAMIINENGGVIAFGQSPSPDEVTSAEQAVILNKSGSLLFFQGFATAASATITVEGGAQLVFFDNTTGGNAQITAKAGGVVDFSGSYGPNNDDKLSVGSIAGAGEFILGPVQLTVGGNNLSTEVSGTITDGCGCAGSGGSLVKVGTGTLTLSGTNTYTGPTIVEGGKLVVNGSLVSAVTVDTAGTLGGTGTIGGLVLNGTLAPGNSIGTMTVAGNAVLNAGSTTVIEVSGTSADRLNVTGAASLAGTLSLVGIDRGLRFGTTYTLLSAAGGRSGTFDAVSTSGTFTPAIAATVSYTATDVELSLSANRLVPLLPPGTPINPTNVAAAIDRALVGGADVSAFIPLYLLSQSALPQALSRLSGEAATGTEETALRAASLFLNLMLDPMAGARGALANGASPSLIQMADPPAGRPGMPGTVQGWSLWTKAFGQASRLNADPATGANAHSSGIYGVAAGADRRLTPDTLVGFALAGGGTSYGLGGRGGGTGDLFQIGLYGSTRLGPAYVSAAMAYGWNSFDINRNVDLAGPEVYRSRLTAHTFGGRLEAGWRFGWQGFGLTPYGAVEVIGYSAPRYSEATRPAGGVFGLDFAARSHTTARTELGIRLDGKTQLAEGTDLIAYGRLAWAYQPTTQRSVEASFQSLPNSAFTVFGARPSMHTALAAAGAELRFASGLSLTSSMEAELGERHQAIRGTLGLRKVW
ncbi:autotransporter domain-containing protein [Phreatobacter sp. AB_2022a]|uniref:autotransporter domain-containing protein n=1 Tax=Phreatobacter sp. AB_2022a TaxID=3003134 RepID=UPI002286D204|nr:autotransporter domain-containing protein [Phreatobacter sp. AB_2022a]MCZ0734606.1 autotransporter domain-containing protein [Phreatobacter sp. AB_2022a]